MVHGVAPPGTVVRAIMGRNSRSPFSLLPPYFSSWLLVPFSPSPSSSPSSPCFCDRSRQAPALIRRVGKLILPALLRSLMLSGFIHTEEKEGGVCR